VEFGEAKDATGASKGKRLSEPDLIIIDDGIVMFIEAKFGSSNKTPSGEAAIKEKQNTPKKYCCGGQGLIDRICSAPYKDIIANQKYELLRMWLLGSWATESLGSNWKFILGNLVRDTQERKIVEEFGRLINCDTQRKFARLTWEQIYDCVVQVGSKTTRDLKPLKRYFEQRTYGIYENKKEREGSFRRAFEISKSV
jgi:hypothetical protein